VGRAGAPHRGRISPDAPARRPPVTWKQSTGGCSPDTKNVKLYLSPDPDEGRTLRLGSGQALRLGSGQALRLGSGQALRQAVVVSLSNHQDSAFLKAWAWKSALTTPLLPVEICPSFLPPVRERCRKTTLRACFASLSCSSFINVAWVRSDDAVRPCNCGRGFNRQRERYTVGTREKENAPFCRPDQLARFRPIHLIAYHIPKGESIGKHYYLVLQNNYQPSAHGRGVTAFVK
jgi:hypothetical protein